MKLHLLIYYNIRFISKYYVGKYILTYRILRFFNYRLINNKTIICIEGFQRSGNTFIHEWFKYNNKNLSHKIADHSHITAQLKRSIKNKIPTIVTIRDPFNVVSSTLFSNNKLSVNLILRTYIDYYNFLLKNNDKLIIISFENFLKYPNELIFHINQTYNRDFQSNKIDNETETKIFKIIKKRNSKKNKPKLLAIPNKKKKKIKLSYRNMILSCNIYDEAKKIYQKVLEKDFYKNLN